MTDFDIRDGLRRAVLVNDCVNTNNGFIHAGVVMDLVAFAVGGTALSVLRSSLTGDIHRVDSRALVQLTGLHVDQVDDLVCDAALYCLDRCGHDG